MKPKKNTYHKQVIDGVAFYFHFVSMRADRYCGFGFEMPVINYFQGSKLGMFRWRDFELCDMGGYKPISRREYNKALRSCFKTLLSEKTTVKEFA